MRIAIVGAGMAGLACADGLAGAGHRVRLFDKGRGPGGRMSARRVTVGDTEFRFDHGAQYFTARDPAFVAEVDRWAAAGVAARWPAAGSDAWVGTPAMNAPVKALAARHDVQWGARVDAVEGAAGQWRLAGVDVAGLFDAVLVAVPAEQAATLLASVQPGFGARAASSVSAPCWTAMIAFARPIASDRAIVRDAGPIGWATCDGAKPGHDGRETWVVQGSPEWSRAHLEDEAAEVASRLLAALADATGSALPEPIHLSAHRWRYARSSAGAGDAALWDPGTGIGACGDWLIGPRVEAAFLSGRALAGMIG